MEDASVKLFPESQAGCGFHSKEMLAYLDIAFSKNDFGI